MSVTRRDFLSGAGAAALAAAFPRCASANARSNESRLNLLLFIADDLGATLGCYGDGQARTPHLDGFAYECVRFERAFVTMASCSPSRSSILSGLYPHQNGQIGLAHYSYSMAPGLPNLVSLLKEAGYRTGIIGKLHVNPASDFPYDDRGLEHSRTRDVRAAAADAGRFFAENGQRPFFLHFNVVDPHTPLLDQYQGLPERPMRADEATVWPWIGLDHPTLRQRIAGYYNCVSRVDTAFGLVLDELRKHGLEENTLIVVLGDHGPPFTRGKASIYEAGLRIPLLVRWPGRSRPGVVRREMVSTIDLLPTLCEAAGAPLPKGLPGRSMAPLIGDRKARWRELLFAEYTTHPPEWFFPMRSVRDDRCKLIHNLLAPARPNPITLMDNCPARDLYEKQGSEDASARRMYETYIRPPEFELYDLREDPCERNNLAGRQEMAKMEARLKKALLEWRKETRDPLLDGEELARLLAEHDALMARVEAARRDGADSRRITQLRQFRAGYHIPARKRE